MFISHFSKNEWCIYRSSDLYGDQAWHRDTELCPENDYNKKPNQCFFKKMLQLINMDTNYRKYTKHDKTLMNRRDIILRVLEMFIDFKNK